MTEFNNRVRDSAAVANLRQANDILAQLSTMNWAHPTRVDLIHRLSIVGKDTLARLSSNRELITESTLNNLASSSQEFLNWINNLASTSTDDDSYWHETNYAADNLLVAASTLPALRIRTTGEVFEKAAQQFDHEVQSSISTLSERMAEISSELSDIGSRIEQTSTQFNNQATRMENSIKSLTEETHATRNSLRAQIADTSKRVEREFTSIHEVFRDSQRARDEEFRKSQAEKAMDFSRRLSPIVVDVEGLRDQARSMLEEVAGASSAEHYAKQRDAQKSSADRWRWIGLGALGTLVAVAAGIFVEAAIFNREFSVTWLVARSSVLAAVVLVATYALRQSSQHRRREEEIDRVANELALLWPFMSRLPDDDRKELMRGITPLYFKGGIPMHNQTEHSSWLDNLRDLVGRRQSRSSDV